jgi:predicted NBD/HSP70 family sugar kinase
VGGNGRSSGALSAAVAPSLLREMNQRLLLERLFTKGPAIRPQLARDTGLSLPTVIAALAGLEDVGLVRTTTRTAAAQGRPAALYEANPMSGTVVGIDVGHEWLRTLVTDLAGTRLAHHDVRNIARSAGALVDLVRVSVDETVAEASLSSADITHTVIGSPGVYDSQHGRIKYAANLPGWERTGLAEALTERLVGSITIDNDANLAALGEHTYGAAKGVQDFVYITIGTGVGLGLVLDGHLYRGARGAAGEAGYLPLGRPLKAGRTGPLTRGMLEESLAADAVVGYAVKAGMKQPKSAERVFAAARSGDAAAKTAIVATAEVLAELIATVLALFDPELIVLGGGVGQNLDLLEPHVRRALTDLSPMEPNLVPALLGSEAVLMGATSTGITAARDLVFRQRIENAG